MTVEERAEAAWAAWRAEQASKPLNAWTPDQEFVAGFLAGFAVGRESVAEMIRVVLAESARRPGERIVEAVRRDDGGVVPAGGGGASGFYHTGLKAHDGWAPHSHEVRADHEGVARFARDPEVDTDG